MCSEIRYILRDGEKVKRRKGRYFTMKDGEKKGRLKYSTVEG